MSTPCACLELLYILSAHELSGLSILCLNRNMKGEVGIYTERALSAISRINGEIGFRPSDLDGRVCV